MNRIPYVPLVSAYSTYRPLTPNLFCPVPKVTAGGVLFLPRYADGTAGLPASITVAVRYKNN